MRFLDEPPPDFLDAIEILWQPIREAPSNLITDPAFKRLDFICTRIRRDMADDFSLFALANAIRSLGPPFLMSDKRTPRCSAQEAARQLYHALVRTEGERTHLCPLDLASDLPDIAFGEAEVRNLDEHDLAVLLDAPRLACHYPEALLDLERLSRFSWLIVREKSELSAPPRIRANPWLELIGRDLGRITPHRTRLPQAVEAALFVLTLLPWEDWTNTRFHGWQAFQLPWAYTVDDDLFVRPAPPPSPDSLTWRDDFFRDPITGKEIEYQRPEELPLEVPKEVVAGTLKGIWEKASLALSTGLFATPGAHFLVRAFIDDPLDAFIAHLIMIEAALGRRTDFRRRHQSDPARGLSPTDRIAARVAGLLNDAGGAEDYRHLFDLRSDFVHGRALDGISMADQVRARRLARRVAEELVNLAVAKDCPSRDDLLNELVKKGRPMLPQKQSD